MMDMLPITLRILLMEYFVGSVFRLASIVSEHVDGKSCGVENNYLRGLM